MFYLQGYRSLSPGRLEGNGSENWVHLVKHLLAKCRQKEIRSSPKTGKAASKNNPLAQKLRNPAQMVTSAAEQSLEQVKVSNNFSTCEQRVQLGIQCVGILLTILLREQAGMCCCRSAGGSVWAA